VNDESAAERLSRLYPTLVARVVLALRGRFHVTSAAAEDVAHDIIADLLERPEKVAPLDDRHLVHFVVRAAFHRAIDAHRRSEVTRDKRALLIAGEPHTGVNDVDDDIDARRRARQIRAVIAEIQEPYHTIFTSMIERDLSLAEVARALNLPLKSIYQQFRRGAALVRERLTQE
jgi:RNA polymerase sigma factor (sigma-70 family)